VLDLFPQLAERMRQRAGTLSGGEQQMLVLGRALMSRPRLLLLDEPSMGIAPNIVRDIYATLLALVKTETLTVLVVEQDASAALSVADEVHVMTNGLVRRSGPPAAFRNRDDLQRYYLGAPPTLIES
jgi:branched-chain amino acid transport system ATP-binding protein